jgi:peptidoglycan/xylan/chitin deacetylase (PgdA/CDA1 family)
MTSPTFLLLKALGKRAGLSRNRVAKARMALERHTLASIPRTCKRKNGRILCYHSVGEQQYGVNDVSPIQFRRQIEFALREGYRFVPASQIAREGGQQKDLAITFDDGCVSVYERAAPILGSYGVPWSFFVVSSWCEQTAEASKVLTWRQVRRLVEEGAELGSHSATHPDFGAIDSVRLDEELLGSRELIQKRTGAALHSFAIPLGQSMNWTADAGAAARKAGYDICYAQAEATRPPGTVARTFVTAFDNDRIFKALLAGAFDRWEEWY